MKAVERGRKTTNMQNNDRDSDSGTTWRDSVVAQLSALNAQMSSVVKKEDLARMEGALKSHAHQAAVEASKNEVKRQHDLCMAEMKKRESVPPRAVISPKGWDTIKYIATLAAAGIFGGSSFAGLQQLLK